MKQTRREDVAGLLWAVWGQGVRGKSLLEDMGAARGQSCKTVYVSVRVHVPTALCVTFARPQEPRRLAPTGTYGGRRLSSLREKPGVRSMTGVGQVSFRCPPSRAWDASSEPVTWTQDTPGPTGLLRGPSGREGLRRQPRAGTRLPCHCRYRSRGGRSLGRRSADNCSLSPNFPFITLPSRALSWAR